MAPSARRPWNIDDGQHGPGATPVAASGIRSYPQAVQAIVDVLAGPLGLPIPAYRMEVHSDPAEFEQALVRHLGVSAETARQAAGFAKAAVGSRRILVNDTLMSRDAWPERLLTLAHEMVHATQLELAGHQSLVRNQWLVEGFAEWVAFRVVQELGTHSLADERASMLRRVRTARDGRGLAPLADLHTFAQWVREREQRGFDAAYPYAYFVTDMLIERHGYAQVLEYFRRHRSRGETAAHFQAAFGESVPQFQQVLDRRMAELLK
ncbi:MAG: hypothetical protein H7Z15_12885 [Rhizobacter sp.]|nr:hypothetical protein [Rhizobacter sp.]